MMTRREALQTLLALPFIAGCGAGYTIAAATEKDGVISIELSEFSGTAAVLVRSRRPIYVFRSEAGAFTAVSAACTHNGCELEMQGDLLACPCHGSEFDVSGTVLHGPAARNLKQFPVIESGSAIQIALL